MTITIRTESTTDKLLGFPAYADRLLRDAVKEGSEFGHTFMTAEVPRGDTERLAASVEHHGPFEIEPGHYTAFVGVNSVIAPYALRVNRGTGVQGPWHLPVTILRMSRKNPSRPGAMKFVKLGEKAIYRRVVKARPSAKIERGKGFVERTQEAMRDWTRIRSGVLTGQFALYYVDRK